MYILNTCWLVADKEKTMSLLFKIEQKRCFEDDIIKVCLKENGEIQLFPPNSGSFYHNLLKMPLLSFRFILIHACFSFSFPDIDANQR